MIIYDPNFRQLAVSRKYIIGHIFEDAYLINKHLKSEVRLGDMYGDPTFAIISNNEEWCLVGVRN